MQNSVVHVDVRVSIHATEDEKKVERATRNVVSPNHGEEIAFEETHLKGYYGNPITLLETRIRSPEIIRILFRNLSARLSASDRRTILPDADAHIESRNLYIRLDKQAALNGDLKLRKDDPIHIRIHFKGNMIETCQALGLVSER